MEYIKRHRHLENREICKKLGITESSFYKYTSKVANPPIELINKLIEFQLGLVSCPTCKGSGYLIKDATEEGGENK